jgi:uncharacterized protein YggE
MKTIRVTGKANMKVAPEQTKVRLTIRGFAMEYGDALAKSVEDTKIIKDAIESCGIDRASLKTENFYTSEKTKSVKDQYGNTSYRHIGYDVTHYLNFTFDNNNEILGKVLYVLSKLSINPRIDVSYVIKDSEVYKTELIALAVEDAKRKALAMTNAAQVTLGDIVSMDYSYETFYWESRQYVHMDCDVMCKADAAFDVDMTPEDANIADTVTIVWEIK